MHICAILRMDFETVPTLFSFYFIAVLTIQLLACSHFPQFLLFPAITRSIPTSSFHQHHSVSNHKYMSNLLSVFHLYHVLFALLFLRTVVSNTYCVAFLFCFSSSCVPDDASFSGLSTSHCPFE